MTVPVPKRRSFLIDNLGPLLGAGYLLFWDLGTASFVFSILVCPIWFLVSVGRSVNKGTESRIALLRAAIPVVILGIAVANTFIQWKIADVNGERIVRACESFHSDNGRYPKTLNELVPRYLLSIPPAKYAMDGDFHYHNSRDADDASELPPILWWDQFGPLHKIYSFDSRGWHHID